MRASGLSRRRVAGCLCLAVATLIATRGRTRPIASSCSHWPVGVRFEAGRPSSGWLRLGSPSDEHVRVTAFVRGAALPAIFDSGATVTVIDRAWARSLGLSLRDGFHARGLTGPMSGHFADGVSVRLAAATFEPVTVGVLDLDALKLSARRDIALILGQDLLASVVVEIDAASGRANLHAARAKDARWPGRLVTLRRAECRRHVLPLSIEGRDPIDAVLDLGSSVPLYLAPEYARAHRLLADRKTSTALTAGGEGLEGGAIATLSALQVGGVTIPQVPVVVPEAWNEPSPALVGWPVLGKFRLFLDLAQDRLWLQPEPGALRVPLPKDRSGLGMAWMDGRLVIVHVARGSPAEAIGLRVGEIIAGIDGTPVAFEDPRLRSRLGARTAGTAYRLAMADGGERRLVLEDYY
ncbi:MULTISPECIES: aspartyl protease family protein [unclassified Phenylobacterium]|uniref:aspartyl protease family protein n=1 Tax=unclassified Phenylobacterium TaxID=2640670 RepID=UPI0009EC78B6|nr:MULTISPECIES: aspartyl protease family protein [unclassified Phenylobacterium]